MKKTYIATSEKYTIEDVPEALVPLVLLEGPLGYAPNHYKATHLRTGYVDWYGSFGAGAHKDVLFAFLNDLGMHSLISDTAANVPEAEILEGEG